MHNDIQINPSILTLNEHSSYDYRPRTIVNATSADLTVAIAADFTTAGEKLTKKESPSYLALSIERPAIENARILYRHMRDHDIKTLNIAGNGIYTLAQHYDANQQHWTQLSADSYVYQLLLPCHQHWGITSIRSGGQTGIDQAGLVAAVALGIPAVGLWPQGYRIRTIDNVDMRVPLDELQNELLGRSERLLRSSIT